MSAENGKLEVESGQDFVPMEKLTDSGDATNFNMSGSLLSKADGTDILVRLDGLTTGGKAVPTASTDDSVDIAAATYNLTGIAESSNAAVIVVPRPTVSDFQIISITLDSTNSLSVVEGTEGSSFTETRDVAGGPPLIPVGDIEICQVRYDSKVAAQIVDSEIKQVTGQHKERSDFPLANVDATVGSVTLNSPLPAIHVGTITREIHAEYSTPIFAEIKNASDFVPAEISDSSSSIQVYSNTVASVSSTLNQGAFNALLDDGVNDSVVVLKGQTLWFKMFPNRLKSAAILTQGKLAIARTFPADDNLAAACTVTAAEESTEQV